MKLGSIITLRNIIESQLSGLHAMNRIQSVYCFNSRLASLWFPLFWDAHGIMCIRYLEKGWTIKINYCIAWLESLRYEISQKNGPI
uniref:Histonelysine Nmethyltransferase SETMARlike [Hydra vulgaris] n=1 Tax=Lepeophtheirus salmonis TaxID=72036 RepID=A0A0K2T4F1_LEPSM